MKQVFYLFSFILKKKVLIFVFGNELKDFPDQQKQKSVNQNVRKLYIFLLWMQKKQ